MLRLSYRTPPKQPPHLMASSLDWRSQHPNVYRADGGWVSISTVNKGFRGKTAGGKITLPTRSTPALAAADVDKVLYKLHRPDADTNGTLTPEVKAQLDGLSLEELVAQIKATGGQAFSSGQSAYRGVCWYKQTQKWIVQFKPRNGQRLTRYCNSELEAARQYDALCKQYNRWGANQIAHGSACAAAASTNRPLDWYNFPPSIDEQEAPAAAAAAAAAATPAPPVLTAAASPLPPSSPPPAPAAAVPAAATAPAAAAAPVPVSATIAAVPSTTPSSSTWQQWLEGDEGEWWTDSSDWEEDWEGEEEEGEQQGIDHQGVSQQQPGSAAGPSSCSAGTILTSQRVPPPPPAAAAAAGGVDGGGEVLVACPSSILATPSAATAAPSPAATSSTPAAATAATTAAAAGAPSLHTTALATAWHQVHGDLPLPQETLDLFGATAPAAPPQLPALPAATGPPLDMGPGDSMLAAAAPAADAAAFVQVTGCHSSSCSHSSKKTFGSGSSNKQSVGQQQQQQGLVLPPAVMAAAAATRAHMTDAWEHATSAGIASTTSAAATAAADQPMFAFGSSGLSSSRASRQQQQGKQVQREAVSTPAAPALCPPSSPSSAAAIAAVGVTSSTAATHVTIECEYLNLLGDNPLMVKAAVVRAAAAITNHPRTISTADQAVAAAGSEPPELAVDEIETALRTAALKSVKQLQPGNSHYWRGPATWRHMDQHPICMTSTPSSTAAVAAEVAATAANPQAAADAALAAAHAAGRGCRISDLHAAWLMQRLQAGVLRVTLQRPAVNMAVLEQALADYGVDPIPGLDYDPVPGLHPELAYSSPHPGTATAAISHNTTAQPPAQPATPAAPGAAASASADPGSTSSRDTATPMDICPTPSATPPPAQPADTAPISIDWAAALAAAEDAAAASAAYPFPLPSDHKPFDDISSDEEEEPYEAQWVADLIEERNPFAAAGPRPPYGSSSSSTSTAGRGSSAAAAAAAAGGGSSSGSDGCKWDAAKHRQRHKERVGFRRQDIPTIKIDWTGNEMSDTVTFLKAVVSEGEADHLPSHIRAYRIAEMVKQKDPGFPLDHLLSMGRPIEGEYCPVVLGVPPPNPDAPAAAATAAAAPAASVRRPALKAKTENAFDPVNRRPPQALLLPGCSYTGQKAAARRATAAARGAMLPAEEAAAAVGLAAAPAAGAGAAAAAGAPAAPAAAAAIAAAEAEGLPAPTQADRDLAFRRITMVGGDKLVQLLRPMPHEQARAAGGAVQPAATSSITQGDKEWMDEDDAPASAGAAAAAAVTFGSSGHGQQIPSKPGRRTAKAVRGSSGTSSTQAAVPKAPVPLFAAGTGAAAAASSGAAAAAAPNSNTAEEEEGESVVASAAAAAAAKLRTLTSCNEVPAAATATPQACRTNCSNSAAPAAAAAPRDAAAARQAAAVSTHLSRPAAANGKSHADRVSFLREMQRKARATLAAAATAPVIAAGAPSYTTAAEDHHLAGVHPSLLAAAAEAATEAATAALQPQPMEVDWNHPEDTAAAVGLWEPAQQQASAAYAAALQAAKHRAAQLAGKAQGSAGEGASQEAAAAGSAATEDPTAAVAGTLTGAAGASSSNGTSARGSSAYLQEQVGLLMGFIKADSCPAISAAEEAALGIKMPRPLAIVHSYSSAAPAAGAAAAAVVALVPGGGSTYSSSEDYPTAGSVADVTRVSYGAAQKQQQGMVAYLQHKADQLLRYQKLKEDCKAAMDSGGPAAADAVLQAAKAAGGLPQGLQDPNAWVDSSPSPEMLYREAGGSGSWEEARARLLPMSRDMPAVAAAVQLGLKLCAAMTNRLEQRLDASEAEQQLMGDEAAGFDAGFGALGGGDAVDVAALVGEVLPAGLPLRARENALLAFRAALRLHSYYQGRDFPTTDPFDLYYEVKPSPDPEAFWSSVERGEVGQGQDGWTLPQPRVRFVETDARLEWFNTQLDDDEKQRVIDAELRWHEECRIVQEARRMQLEVITAPGTLLHDMVRLGARMPLDKMNPMTLAETGRWLFKTPPSERPKQLTEGAKQALAASQAALRARLAVLVPPHMLKQQSSG